MSTVAPGTPENKQTQECQDTLQHTQPLVLVLFKQRFTISMPALLYLNLLPTGGTVEYFQIIIKLMFGSQENTLSVMS